MANTPEFSTEVGKEYLVSGNTSLGLNTSHLKRVRVVGHGRCTGAFSTHSEVNEFACPGRVMAIVVEGKATGNNFESKLGPGHHCVQPRIAGPGSTITLQESCLQPILAEETPMSGQFIDASAIGRPKVLTKVSSNNQMMDASTIGAPRPPSGGGMVDASTLGLPKAPVPPMPAPVPAGRSVHVALDYGWDCGTPVSPLNVDSAPIKPKEPAFASAREAFQGSYLGDVRLPSNSRLRRLL